MITFENIRVAFGEFVAVPDFSLEIEEGEFFTLLGPSGCGKTTILRALAGLNTPCAGRIKIDGKDVTNAPSDKRQIGMVFQNYALFPSMSVEANIGYGLKVARTPKSEIVDRVREIANEVELNKTQLKRNVSELSGGQQQRVAIARALVLRPKILLLDEPLSNLDAKLRSQLRLQLKEMQEHFGITSVYVTHDQEEALTMSDRLAVLHAGKLEQVGTPRDIYARSSSEFVCTFIGDANSLDLAFLRQVAPDCIKNFDRFYLRVEQVHINDSKLANRVDSVTVPAEVVASRYQGTVSVYTLKLNAGGQTVLMKAIEKEDGSHTFGIGENVEVSFPKRSILAYNHSHDASGL